jgi:adhesin transport system membrane fusion protein
MTARDQGPLIEASGAATAVSRQRYRLLWTMVAVVLGMLLWAAFSPLDVASYAQGQVIPAGQLKKIQHLEGGIIRNLNVVEGQVVKAGQVIAEIEDIASGSDAGDLRSRAGALEIKSMRINAQLSQQALRFPPELEKNFPDFCREARQAYESGRERYASIVKTNEAKIAQRQAEIQEAKERLAGLQSRSKIIADQVKISEALIKQKLSSDYDHLQLLKEQAQIDSDRDGTIATQRRAAEALEEARATLATFRREEEVNLRKELQDASTELASLRERLRKPSDSYERTLVRSPVAGSIMTLYFKNRGAVVSPGGVIATLVPEGEALLIEAKLPISEVGYVHLGERARLSVSASGSGFSTVDAKVVHVSPDSVADEKTGVSYYVVRLEPEEFAFHRGTDSYPLRPGVQVTAAIITGQRSVLALLLDPFQFSGVKPLTER